MLHHQLFRVAINTNDQPHIYQNIDISFIIIIDDLLSLINLTDCRLAVKIE